MAIANGQKADADNFNAAFADIDFQTIAAGTNFTIVNNQSAAANVTSLLFDKTLYRSCVVRWQVYRKTTGGGANILVQVGRALVWHDDTNWYLTQETMSSVDAGVLLDIVAATGQVQYTSTNQAGTYSAGTSILTWQIEQTMRL